MINNNQKGFTLIELLVYLGLFAMLFTGTIATAYNIFESNGRNQTKAMVQEEGDFLIAKINWALSGASAVNLPLINSLGSILSTNKLIGTNTIPIEIKMDALTNIDMTLARSGNPPATLNNNNVQISNLNFIHNNVIGEGIDPESVIASFTLSARTSNGSVVTQDFSSTNYLRK